MVIRTNKMSINANRQLGRNDSKAAGDLEKLASGFRINRASDDASGLAISEKMRAQIRGLEQGSVNIKDGMSLINTADGYLNELAEMAQRIRELAVKASNGTYEDTDRTQIQKEIDDLVSEIDRVTSSAEFNTIKLFQGGITDIQYAPLEYETITPMDPAYIYANEPFGALGDVRIMYGTQAELTIAPSNNHLAELDAGPHFPNEGVFIISVGIPGPPAQSRNATLDFGALNGPGSQYDGSFSLKDFREFFRGEDTGTVDPVTGNPIYAGGAFSDWINAGELSFEITDAGEVNIKTLGMGGSNAFVTFGAKTPLPTGKILANSAILGATDSSSVSKNSYNFTGVSSALLTVPITASDYPITSEELWSLIPDNTSFLFQIRENTWYPPTSGSPNGYWGSPTTTVATQTYTKAQIDAASNPPASNVSQANSNLSTLAAGNPHFSGFYISLSHFIDRDGQVRMSIIASPSRNTALYPEEPGKPTGKYSNYSNWASYPYSIHGAMTSSSVNTGFPYVTSDYPINVSDNIGTLEISIGSIPTVGTAKVVINFADNTIRNSAANGAILETFSDEADMVAKLTLALNRPEYQPVPPRTFPASGATGSIAQPVAEASISTVNGQPRLRITAAERMFTISVNEYQSDRPMFEGGNTSKGGTNQTHRIRINGTPSVEIPITSGVYDGDIDKFIADNKAAFQPHYILRADDTGTYLVIESVAKGDTVDVRDIQFSYPATTTPSNLLSLLGFDNLPFDDSTWFVDGVTHPSYQKELPPRVIGVEVGANPVWIQGGAEQGEGLYVMLPYISASQLQLKEYEIPQVAKEAGITFSTSGKPNQGINVMSIEGANSAVDVAGNAIITLTSERASFGATSNTLQHMMANVDNAHEKLTASESKIRDLDMAKAMMEHTKNTILTQAAQAMLAQANQEPQAVLQLLQ